MKILNRLALLLLLIMIPLSACAGAGDWNYDDLPGNFEVWRVNGKNVSLVLANENGVTASTVVPTYVFEVGHTDRYIFAKQAEVSEDKVVNYSVVHYHIVDVNTAETFGPLDEQAFKEKLKELGIEETVEWIDLKAMKK